VGRRLSGGCSRCQLSHVRGSGGTSPRVVLSVTGGDPVPERPAGGRDEPPGLGGLAPSRSRSDVRSDQPRKRASKTGLAGIDPRMMTSCEWMQGPPARLRGARHSVRCAPAGVLGGSGIRSPRRVVCAGSARAESSERSESRRSEALDWVRCAPAGVLEGSGIRSPRRVVCAGSARAESSERSESRRSEALRVIRVPCYSKDPGALLLERSGCLVTRKIQVPCYSMPC